MVSHREVVFVASENGALPGGKVGGVADVVRDLPVALAEFGWRARVVTPSYGSLHKLPGAELITSFEVDFAGTTSVAELWQGSRQQRRGKSCDSSRALCSQRRRCHLSW